LQCLKERRVGIKDLLDVPVKSLKPMIRPCECSQVPEQAKNNCGKRKGIMSANILCPCLFDRNHEHWIEWNHNFNQIKNVRIVPNKDQYKGPERRYVHYPLVRSILNGGLAENGFKDFKKGSILVLCNFMIPLSKNHATICDWKDRRPDIICISSKGKVFVIECKPRSGLSNRKDLEKDISSFLTLKLFASSDPIEFKKNILSSPLDKWEKLYNNRYPRHLSFPHFRDTLNQTLDIKTEKEIIGWTGKVMDCISNDDVRFGFAFDGSIDEAASHSLQFFCDCFKSTIGHGNHLFYFAVNRDESFGVKSAEKIHQR